MLQLGKLHLQLALVGTGALGENIENQPGAIHHPALQFLLQVAFLAGTEGVVEHDHLGLHHVGSRIPARR